MISEPPQLLRPDNPSPSGRRDSGLQQFAHGWWLTSALLMAGFGIWLFDLIEFSLNSTLFSHIPLVPLASGYFGWRERHTLFTGPPAHRSIPLLLWIAGAGLLAAYGVAIASDIVLPRVDALALTTGSFLFFFGGTCAWFFSKRALRTLAFPLGFLVFMVPIPKFLTHWIEIWLQHGSAFVAAIFFRVGGATFFQPDSLVFELPGITLQVAPECSGIHSTLALLITSVAAGWLFLRSPWKRVTLALAVIPLALLRNGFRVFVIGELCVRISPDMIHSYIHRQGGPIFFALSLIPLSLFLLLLVRSERQRQARVPAGKSGG